MRRSSPRGRRRSYAGPREREIAPKGELCPPCGRGRESGGDARGESLNDLVAYDPHKRPPKDVHTPASGRPSG